MTLAGLGIAFEAYFSLAGRDAGTALLATMIALKTLELRRPRDLRLFMVLFGFLLVSQFLFDQSPGRALYLGAVVRRQSGPDGGPGRTPPRPPFAGCPAPGGHPDPAGPAPGPGPVPAVPAPERAPCGTSATCNSAASWG